MENSLQRLRITYAKGESLRFISHLDLARTWERALRRASIPVAYSKGFHPHPKIVFAAALAVGCTGDAEVMDIVLSQPIPPRRVLRGLAYCMPEGLQALDVTPVYDRAPALPALLCGADYESRVDADLTVEQAQAQVEALLAQASIPREFRGKSYDLRPLIEGVQVVKLNARYLVVRMELVAGQRGTGRLEEVLDALGWLDFPHSCHRRGLRFADGGDAPVAEINQKLGAVDKS